MGVLGNDRLDGGSAPPFDDDDDGVSVLEGSSRVSDSRLRALGLDRRAGTTASQRNLITGGGASRTTQLAPGVGDGSIRPGRPQAAAEVIDREEIQAAAEQEAIEEVIDEREEILEERGGNSEPTEELGDDANEEIQVVKKSLSVLYGFNANFTSDEFYESLSPIFLRLSSRRNASPQERRRVSQLKVDTRNAGRESILLAQTTLKAGKTRIVDYKALTNINEPSLKLSTRQYFYKSRERRKLARTLRSTPYPIEKLQEGISLFLNAPQFERIEGPMIVNKFEIENQFRLSPIDDAQTQVVVQSDSRAVPTPGSYLQKINPDTSTFRGDIQTDNLAANERTLAGGPTGDGTKRGIDTGLIRDLDRDRRFREEDFGAASDLEFDRLQTGGPPGPGPGGPTGGGPRGY
jgi:hypothetical protein